jgi:signal transduction histidine kinase
MLFPYGVLFLEDRTARPVYSAGHLCAVLADLVLLASALVLSFDARLTGCLARARLSSVATLIAVQDLPLVVIAITDPAHSAQSYRLTAGHLVSLSMILLLLNHGVRGRRPIRLNPMVLGFLLGLAVLAVRLGLMALDHSPYLGLTHPGDLLVILAIVGLVAINCDLLLRSGLPRWAALRMTAGIAVLFAARLYATARGATSPPIEAIVGVVLCSALLATSVVSMLMQTLSATTERETTLRQRAAEAEATVQHDREVVHEVRAATAGIVAGVHLLTSGQVPPGPRRTALQHMVDAEAARLGRSLAEQGQELSVLDLDEIVEPLVMSQEVIGHRVTWQPGHHRVVGRHDPLAEVFNVLLNNARRHAHGHATAVTSRAVGDVVEVRVSDCGPGIDPEIRDRLFQWGARGAFSTGQGIGLQRAHRLMLELGGSLDVDTTRPAGACFVVTLPRADVPAARLVAASNETSGLAG